MEAWSSISETTFALTPSPSSSVAHVWRRSWKRRSSRMPMRQAMIGARDGLPGVQGQPMNRAEVQAMEDSLIRGREAHVKKLGNR